MGEQPRRPDQSFDPPLPSLAAGARAGVFRGFLVVIFGTGPGRGLFVYSGTPALGNLIYSIAASSGIDPYGNAYLSGATSYGSVSGTFYAMQQSGMSLAFSSATSAAGPYVSLSSDLTFETSFTFLTGAGLRLEAANVVVESSEASGGTVALVANNGQILIETITSVAAAVSNASVEIQTGTNAGLFIQGTATTTDGVELKVSGDTNLRYHVNVVGNTFWGSGSGAADVELSRLSANRLGVGTADLSVHTTGRGLQVAEGSNAKQNRNATLVAGSVVVANTAVTANSMIVPGYVTPSANAGALFVSSVTAGTGFTIKSTNGADTSVVGYEIFEPG